MAAIPKIGFVPHSGRSAGNLDGRQQARNYDLESFRSNDDKSNRVFV
jgi:hypothetical protein